MSLTTARTLDQFYTQHAEAERLYETLSQHISGGLDAYRWVEPAAGDGAFYNLFGPGSIGLDLDPQAPRIERADFLTWTPPASSDPRPLAVLTNPPFGKNASLALKFVNHAAEFAAYVAVIVPRTFEKESMIRRIDRCLHLVHQEVLPLASFRFEGETYSVPTVFQVWERRDALRPVVCEPLAHPDFEFLPYDRRAEADFAFQRNGEHAGRVKDLNIDLGKGSHQWIRCSDRKAIDQVRQTLTSADWGSVKHLTAGNPSIGKTEVVRLYANALGTSDAAPNVAQSDRVRRRKTWFEIIAELEREAGVPPSFTEEEAMSAVRKLGPISDADTLHVQGCSRGALMLALVQVLHNDQQWSHEAIKNWAEKSLFGSCTDETGLRVLKVLWTGYFGSLGLGLKSHIGHNLKCVKALPAKWKGKTVDLHGNLTHELHRILTHPWTPVWGIF